MAKLKLLYVAHEMSPFLELSEISKIVRKLPQEMQDRGFEIRVIMPKFGMINERRNRLHEVIRLSGMNIIIDGKDNPLIIKVASIPAARMQVYFLDNDQYFKRKYVFADGQDKFYQDNDERTIFFCKSALKTIEKLGWSPDIIHCHGWMSALVPLYIKTTCQHEPTFKNAKVVYSLYNDTFDGTLNARFAEKAVLPYMEANQTELFKPGTHNALYQGAIAYSDAVVLHDEIIDASLLQNIKNAQIPCLDFNSTANYQNYASLYEAISAEELAKIA